MTHIDQSFSSLSELDSGQYDNCTFQNCSLAGADLGGIRFLDCTFIDCDLSNASLRETSLQTVVFENCKLIGIHFEDARDFLFKVSFKGCQLELSTFIDWKLPGTSFRECQLLETDFSGANLQGVDFSGSHLNRTIFDRTDLRKTDFVSARNYRVNPAGNRIRGARFSRLGLEGLLLDYGIKVE